MNPYARLDERSDITNYEGFWCMAGHSYTTEYYQCIQVNRIAFKLGYRTQHSFGIGEPRDSAETYERANGRGFSAPAASNKYQILSESNI
jgi:hypothetical protein